MHIEFVDIHALPERTDAPLMAVIPLVGRGAYGRAAALRRNDHRHEPCRGPEV